MNTKIRTCATMLAVMLGSGLAVKATAAFVIDKVDYTQDFSSYELHSTLAENGWTTSGASYFSIQTPSTGGSGQAKIVKILSDETRRPAVSPNLDFDPGYKLGDTIFLSAEIRVTDVAESGVGIGLRNSEGQDIAFLRLMDANPPRRFALRGIAEPYVTTSAEERADPFIWYQILLAIELDAVDITKSTGSLYYRSLNEVGSELTPVSELQGINLGFTEEQNPLDIGYLRIESARSNAEFGNIQIGTGSFAIPEPSHIAGIVGLVAFGVVCFYRRRSRKAV